MSSAAIVERARAVTETRATTFAFACRLLPADVRDDVRLLYLVFRTLDDLVDDGAGDAAARVSAVAAWAAREPGEAGASAGVPETPETELLDWLAARHPLPREVFTDFCRGMEHDLAGGRLVTERDVDDYCYRVAGTVGIVMAAVLGSHEPAEARTAAASLGMAMQRTNILRDIDEDLAAGRIYISEEALARHGGTLEPERRGPLVREQIARADELYDDGLLGVGTLRRGRGAIVLAARMYREILREIERTGLDGRPGRAVVPAGRRLRTALSTAVNPR